MTLSLMAIAESVQGEVLGDGAVAVSGIASIARATGLDLVFVEDEKTLSAALASAAAAIIAGDFARGNASPKPLLISGHPRLAFARAARLLCPGPNRQSGTHSSGVVHASARVGKDVILAERVVIGEKAEIGDRTWIGAGAVIAAGVHIGRDCLIHPNVTIYPGTQIGKRVIVHAGAVLGSDGFGYVRDRISGAYEKFPQVGQLEIGDDVEIGANSTIDRGALESTRIGRGVKIDNLVHVGHNCQIGEDVVIAAQTGLSGSIVIAKNAVLGGQVGIAEHARIEEGVLVGAQAGVLPHKVLRGSGVAFWGTPARPLREYLKQLAALGRLVKK
jgi:UDP-3-O-[3-hydroxymyristoyl] glucosamine N-acyltransferase